MFCLVVCLFVVFSFVVVLVNWTFLQIFVCFISRALGFVPAVLLSVE